MTPEREKSIRETWRRWRTAVGPTLRERGFVNLTPLRTLSCAPVNGVSFNDTVEIFQYTIRPATREVPAFVVCDGLEIEEVRQ